MDDINGDDRVMATAHHIIRTMGSDNANNMLHILSKFDDRFSRFSLSIPRNRDGGEASIPDPVVSAPHSVAIEGAILQKALDMIDKWKFESTESAGQTFIWTGDIDEIRSYLDAVDSIQAFLNDLPQDADSGMIENAENALPLAMLRLQAEFRNLMERSGESIDPDCLLGITYDNHEGEKDRSSLSESEQEAKSFIAMTIDLLPQETVAALSDIASRMIRFSHQAEVTQVFVCCRRSVVEESLQRLGFERLSIDYVQKMPWMVLEVEISKWIRIMKLSIGVLLRSERDLCQRVFKEESSISDAVFDDYCRGIVTHLLDFGVAVAIGLKAPEKLFKILDMYEVMQDLLPSIEHLFVGESCASVKQEGSAVLELLGDAARGTFAELENAVQRETSRNPVPGGAVHPLSRYVMNYIRFFSEYTETLNQLLKERSATQTGSFTTSRHEDANKGPLSAVTISLLDLLLKNLDGKSKLYKDPALTLLFLMNNLHYIVQKSKDAEVRKLVGDEWIRRHSGRLHQYHNDYRRTAWTKVLSYLKDDGISVSGGSMNGVSRNVLKDRFKNFNTAFEESVKTQSGWIVSDSQLCAELQISITGMILPAYRSFLGRFENHLDVVKHRERYVKYTPEDVEEHLNDLFSGSSGSMNRRKAAAGLVV